MNINKLIEFYTEIYPSESYTSIATRIFDNHPEVNYSIRTLRRMVSDFVNSQTPTITHDNSDEYKSPDSFTMKKGSDSDIDLMTYTEVKSSPKIHDEGQYYKDLFTKNESSPAWMKHYVDFGAGDNPFKKKEAPFQPWTTKKVEEYLDTKGLQLKTPTSKTYVVMGCVHLPFQNKAAWSAAMKLIADMKPNGVVLAGDIVDNHSISRHAKGKITVPGLTLEQEYREANIYLDQLDSALVGKVTEKYFM